MEPEVLADIEKVMRWQRKLAVTGVSYDAPTRYAKCLHLGLAAWNKGRSCIDTDDVKAAVALRDNETLSDCLEKYYWLVMGDQGYGMFCEDGGPKGCDLIDFWEQIDPQLRRKVMAEAFLVATKRFSSLDGTTGEQREMVEKSCLADVCEVFIEASSNAREQVEREAKAALSATPPLVAYAKPPEPESPPAPAPPPRKGGRPADPRRAKFFTLMQEQGLNASRPDCRNFLKQHPEAKELFIDQDNLRTQFLNWLKKKP